MSKPVSRGRGRWIALGVVVVVAAGTLAAWRTGAFSATVTSGTGQRGAPPATSPVTRRDLSAVTPVTATLGYAGSYPVTGRGGGTLTWLPSPGRVIRQGQALYRVDNGSPVVLLYGGVPDWRAMRRGTPARTCPSSTTTWCTSATSAARASPRLAGITTHGRPRSGCRAWKSTWGWPARREPAAGAGGVRAEGTAGQPGDREPGRPRDRVGARGDLGPARGDDPAGCLAAVAGPNG